MAEINPYVRTLLLRKMSKNLGLSGAYIRREQIIEAVSTQLSALLSDYDVASRIDVSIVAEQVFQELRASGCFSELDDEFAGSYFRVGPAAVEQYRQKELSADTIHSRAEAIGEQRYFSDVLSAFVSGETGTWGITGAKVKVPASDRIVSLSHNQKLAVEPPLSALIEDVRSDNEQLDDGVKDRLLGQLRAGRELINSGSVRAYLLYNTLIRGLIELTARYRGRAIAVAAEKLIELLIEHIFEGSAT